jgi:hypothetical protein
MAMTTRTVGISLSLDDEGFLRRECPNCVREFKVVAVAKDAAPAPASVTEEYFCPYCALPAGIGSFWTKQQLEYMEASAASEVLGPVLDQFERQMRDLSRASGGLLTVTTKHSDLPVASQPTEPNDMRKVEFTCHSEPVKVASDWTGDIACLVCGTSGRQAS